MAALGAGSPLVRSRGCVVLFPPADPVEVASGCTVYVFNVAGNKYRMIVAIHFNPGRVFTRRLLTHTDYSKGHWKDQL
ncbi:MAG TPA: type II toxin-antitoxin system HigB family toxin [Verrucomicrobiota bacterium]|nr:type II toxin-antitoxin system HigB family toxin [Verrucomicrobiota bacterium]